MRRESPTLATIASQELSSLAKSSACWTRASRVPILNSGILKGIRVPSVTVDSRELKASPSLDIEDGSETRIYLVVLDILLLTY